MGSPANAPFKLSGNARQAPDVEESPRRAWVPQHPVAPQSLAGGSSVSSG